MPIPPLDENGFLPHGIHVCWLEETRSRFGCFQGSDRRPRLFSKLEELIVEARASGIVRALIVNGSFVTAKSAPNDIDLVIVLPAGHDFRADLAPAQYTVVNRVRIRRLYGIDVIVAEDDSADYMAAVQFFQRVRLQPHVSKGILRIEL